MVREKEDKKERVEEWEMDVNRVKSITLSGQSWPIVIRDGRWYDQLNRLMVREITLRMNQYHTQGAGGWPHRKSEERSGNRLRLCHVKTAIIIYQSLITC